jgi:hypothetical protein
MFHNVEQNYRELNGASQQQLNKVVAAGNKNKIHLRQGYGGQGKKRFRVYTKHQRSYEEIY